MDLRDRIWRGFRAVYLCLLRISANRFDFAVLVVAFALFAGNDIVFKRAFLTCEVGWFFKNYFNDCIGGAAFLSYSNTVLCAAGAIVRMERLAVIVPYITCCGFFWEYVAPHFVPASVSDPWDLLAYLAGAVAYWLIAKGIDASERREFTVVLR